LGSLLVALSALALTECNEPPGADPVAGFVRAGTDIAVKSVRTAVPLDALAGTTDVYYIVTFSFTNNQGRALAPRIDRFVLEDEQRRHFNGADSGSATLVGINNDEGILEVGESHDYTAGFRVPAGTRGVLFYDNSY
jgi:hypothetical protein